MPRIEGQLTRTESINFQIETQQQEQQQDFFQAPKNDLLYSKMQDSVQLQNLEKELKMGPPPEVDKWSKSKWKEGKMKQISLLREKEDAERKNFFHHADRLTERMQMDISEQIDKNSILTVDEMENVVSAPMTKLCSDDGKACTLQKLLKGGVQPTQITTQLGNLFGKLSKFTPVSFDEKNAAELIEEYKGIPLTVHASASEYIEREGLIKSPKSAYILLYHCVASALRMQINEMNESQVNMDTFRILCGVADASAVAASELLFRTEFTEKMDENEALLRKEQEEAERLRKEQEEADELQRLAQEQATLEQEKIQKLLDEKRARREKLFEEVKNKIGNIVNAQMQRQKWFSDAAYEELIDNHLREQYMEKDMNAESLQEKETVTMEILLKEIERSTEIINANLVQVSAWVRKQKDMNLGLTRLETMLCKKVAELYGKTLLKSDAILKEEDTRSAEILKEAAEAINVKKYEERKNLIIKNIPGTENSKEFWEDKSTQLLLFQSEEGEITFENAVKYLVGQAKENLHYIERLVKQKISVLHREEAMEMLKQKLGAHWVYSVPAVVRIYADEALSHTGSQMYMIHKKETKLKEMLSEVGISSSWKKAACIYLQENNITVEDENLEAKLIRFKSRIEENNAHYEELLNSKVFTKTQWKHLMSWRNRNAALEQDDYRKQFLKELETVNGMETTGQEMLLMEEYLRGKEEASLKKEIVDYAKRLQGEDLCRWEGFAGQMDKYSEKILDTLNTLLKKGQLTKEFPFLENVHSINALDTLNHIQYDTFLTHIRSNIGRVLESWSTLQCLKQEEIKEKLLPAMVSGQITDSEHLNKLAADEIRKDELTQEANGLRLMVHLGKKTHEPGKIRYQYIENSGTKASWFGKTFANEKDRFHAEERIQKFDYAKQAWEVLRSTNLDMVLLMELYQFQEELDLKRKSIEDKNKAPLEGESLYKFYRNEINAFADSISTRAWLPKNTSGSRMDNAAANRRDISKVLSSIKDEKGELVDLKEFFRELMMCQTDEYVFSTGEKEEAVFAVGTKHEYYLRMMELSSRVIRRTSNMQMGFGSKDQETAKMMFLKARKMIAVLEDAKDISASELQKKSSAVSEKLEKLEQKSKEIQEKILALQIQSSEEHTSEVENEYEELQNQMKEQMRQVLEEEQQKNLEELGTVKKELQDILKQQIERQQEEKDNISKYGVKNWEEFAAQLTNYIVAERMDTQEQIQGEQEKTSSIHEAAELYEKRQGRLMQYKNGLFTLMLPYIEADQECWCRIMTDTDADFEKFLIELDEHIGTAMEVLYENVGKTAMSIAQQYVYGYHYEILNNTYKTRENWEKEVEKYQDDFFSKKLQGYDSMEERLNEVAAQLRENPKKYGFRDARDAEIAWGAIHMAILKDPDSIEILYSHKKLEEAAKNYMRRAVPNEQVVEKSERYKQLSKADQTSLKLALNVKIILTEPEIFEAVYPAWEEEALDALKKVTIQTDTTALKEKETALLQIVQKKEEGRIAGAEAQKTLALLRRQLWKAGSPIVAKWGDQEKILFKKKDVEKAVTTIKEEYDAMPQFLVECLAEKNLVKKFSKEELQKEAMWLLNVYNTTTDLNEEENFLSSEQTKGFVLYAYNQHVEEEIPSKEQLRVWKQIFAGRNELLGSVSGREFTDKSVRMEYQELMQLIQMGMYTMPVVEFEEFVNVRMQYLQNCDNAMQTFDNCISELRKTVDISDDAALRLKLGLREFFDKELLNGEALEQISDKTMEYLNNENMRRYLQDSTSLMGRVAYDDLTAEEKQMQTTVDRKQMDTYLESKNKKNIFQKYLTSRAEHKLLQQYNKLDMDQKKVFALSLLLAGKATGNEFMSTAQLIAGQLPVVQDNPEEIQDEIRKYVSHDSSFNPVIDYGKAMEKLQSGDGELNEALFEQAMKFTQLCITRHAQLTPKDWGKMSDGVSSIEAAYRFSKESKTVKQVKEEYAGDISDSTEFVDKLKELVQKDSDKIEEGINIFKKLNTRHIMERLNKLKGYQMQYLVLALQDRTILDRTTAVDHMKQSEGTEHGFANEEKRELFKGALIYDNNNNLEETVKGSFCTKAMLSLLSYQLRDDVDLRNRRIKEKDFKNGALSRTTVVDWGLLDEALDLVEEISNERLKMNAIRLAPDMINYTSNVQAKDTYQKLEKEVTDEKSFKEFVTSQAIKDQEANKDAKIFLTGYYSLTEAENELFIKVLQNRDMLDVSQNNYWKDLFGIKERDYVNAKGRNDLLDTYLNNSYLDKNRVELDEDAYSKAFKTLLSTQIDDSISFVDMKENESLEEHLVRKNVFQKTRNTAVDWSLLARALQFVKRATNEEMIYKQDREIYVSQGNLEEGGEFQFESGYMRKNLHRTGNRWVRFVARKGLGKIKDNFPEYLQKAVTGILSAKYANEANELLERTKETEKVSADVPEFSFEEEEQKSLTEVLDTVYEKGSTVLEKATGWSETLKKNMGIDLEEDEEAGIALTIGKKVLSEEKFNKVGNFVKGVSDVLDPISTWNGYFTSVIEAGKEIYGASKNLMQLSDAEAKAEVLQESDKEKMQEAEAEQTMEQKELAKQGFERNTKANMTASYGSKQQQFNTIVESAVKAAAEITDAAMELDDELTDITEEVMGTIMFIRQFFVNKEMVERYYDTKNDLNDEDHKLRDAFTTSLEKLTSRDNLEKESTMKKEIRERSMEKNITGLSGVKTRELIQKGNGFEEMEEFMNYTGFNIIHSVLFSASNFGKTMQSNNIVAKAVLIALGAEECIGQQGEEAAMKVYNALMGTKYEG